ncbi:hypothetical protein [Rhodoferax sp.]|uniref:hypothetical protein n=1 Tax=Rhodoferax sp. TaxID=50421 RepID=UPI003BB6D7EC
MRHRSGVHVLERIQSFFDRSLGTPAVATELRDRSKRPSLYQHECSRFMSPKWTKDEEQREFAKVLCEQTHFLATRVIAEENSTREHFEQLASKLRCHFDYSEIQQFICLDNSVSDGLNAFTLLHRLGSEKFVRICLINASTLHNDFCCSFNQMAVASLPRLLG